MTQKVFVLMVCLLAFTINVNALIPTGKYYKGLELELNKGTSLKKALRLIIKNNKVFSYKTARRYLFGSLHIEKNTSGEYQLTDVYCQNTYDKSIGIAPGTIPN